MEKERNVAALAYIAAIAAIGGLVGGAVVSCQNNGRPPAREELTPPACAELEGTLCITDEQQTVVFRPVGAAAE